MFIKTKTISYDNRILAFWTLIGLAIAALLVYVYAINATTRNIAARHDLESEIASLTSRQGALEFTNIELKNRISIEVAAQYGFTEVEAPLYVSRTKPLSLTLATPETRVEAGN